MASNILPYIANPTPPPDLSGPLNSIFQGIEQGRERNALSNLGQYAARGDFEGAQRAAFGSGRLELGAKFAELDLAKKARLADIVAAGGQAADTAEKWSSYLDSIETRLGQDVSEYRDFNMRDSFIAEAVGAVDSLKMQLQREGLDIDREALSLKRAELLLGDEPSGFRRSDGGLEYVPGGPNDPEVIRRAAEARGASRPSETSLDRARARADVSAVTEYREGADSARQSLSDIGQIREMRKGVSYEGGILPRARARAGGVLGMGEGQALQSKALELQLGFTERTKGAITDREMATFAGATPGLQMTDEAAETVLNGMEAGALRKVEQAKFFESWLDEYGKLAGAQDAWDRFIAENPIIRPAGEGKISVNRKNIANWSKYLGEGADLIAKPAVPAGETYIEIDGRTFFIGADGQVYE